MMPLGICNSFLCLVRLVGTLAVCAMPKVLDWQQDWPGAPQCYSTKLHSPTDHAAPVWQPSHSRAGMATSRR
jgi:hypothetical protein